MTVNSKGTLLASASKDETVIVWNIERIKAGKFEEAMLSVLKEHENQIDCIKWAPLEANYTIDQSDYNKSYIAMLSL